MNIANPGKSPFHLPAVMAIVVFCAYLCGVHSVQASGIADLTVNIAPLSATPDVVSVSAKTPITVTASVGPLPIGLVLECPGDCAKWTFTLVKVQYRTVKPITDFTTWGDWDWSSDSIASDVTSNTIYYTDDLVAAGHSGIKHFNFTPLKAGYWHLTVQAMVEVDLRDVLTGVVTTHTNLPADQNSSPKGLTLTSVQIDIYRNPTTTSNGTLLSSSTPINEVVGHKVYLKAVVTPSDLGYSGPTWTVPGDTVYQYQINYDPPTSSSTVLNYGETSGPIPQSIYFYWYTGGNNRSVIARISVGSNSLSANVRFNVEAPTISNTLAQIIQYPSIDNGANQIRFGTNLRPPVVTPPSPFYPPYSGRPGIWFHQNCSAPATPTAFPGTFKYVQVIDAASVEYGFYDSYVGDYYEHDAPESGLDSHYPMPPGVGATDASDSPHVHYNFPDPLWASRFVPPPVCDRCAVQMAFSTFLVFHPTPVGASPDDMIDVPIWRCKWKWSGSIEYNTETNTWVRGPLELNAQIVSSGANVVFPQWSQLAGNVATIVAGSP